MFSVIVLTFNSIKFIRPCLDSLFGQDYKDFELVVVDNGSKDGTVDLIKNNYPGIILIENKENLGACKGRNQGIEASRNEWVLCLDSDVVLERSFLSSVSQTISGLPSGVGILQPKILNIDKKTVYSCGIYLTRIRRFYDIGKGREDSGEFNSSKSIFGGCSAACFYNRKMLKEIKEDTGYFDERFFFLVEDVDLSWRAQRKGWKAMYYPEAVCYHAGQSSGLDRKMRQFLCFRNRQLMLAKNEYINYPIVVAPLRFLYDSLRTPYLFLVNKYVRKEPLEVFRPSFKVHELINNLEIENKDGP